MADPNFPSITGWAGLDTALAYLARWNELSPTPAEPPGDEPGFLQARMGPEMVVLGSAAALAGGELIGWPVLLPLVASMTLLHGHDEHERNAPARPAPWLPPAKRGDQAGPRVIGPDAGTALPPNVIASPPQTDWPAIGHRITRDEAVASKEGGPPEGPDEPGDKKAEDKKAEDKKNDGGKKKESRPEERGGAKVLLFKRPDTSGTAAKAPGTTVLNEARARLKALVEEREKLRSLPASTRLDDNIEERVLRVEELSREIDRLKSWASHLQKRGGRGTADAKTPLTLVAATPVPSISPPAAPRAANPPGTKGELASPQLPSHAESEVMIRRCNKLLGRGDLPFKAALAHALRQKNMSMGPTENQAEAYRAALIREQWLTQKMVQRLKDLGSGDDRIGRFAKKMLDSNMAGWLVRHDIWPGSDAKSEYQREVEASRFTKAEPGRSPPPMPPGDIEGQVKAAVEYIVRQLVAQRPMNIESQFLYLRDATGLNDAQLQWLIRKQPEWFEGCSLADPGLTDGRYAQGLQAARALALRQNNPRHPGPAQLPASLREREMLAFVHAEALPELKRRRETFEWLGLDDLSFDYKRMTAALADYARSIHSRLPKP